MNLIQSHLVSYTVPLNLNGNWSIGFVLGICLVIQLLTGLILAALYVPEVPEAFYSIAYIIDEVHNGYLYRYAHSNGVCIFFMFIYIHLAKGLFYSCSYLPMSWYTGIVILLLTYTIGFLGYVLPFGQMSFWGATVIINLFYWCGALVYMLLGDYTVSGSTVGRFFLLHFILPFVLLVIVLVHIYYLHLNSSSNPLYILESPVPLRFTPTVLSSDVVIMIVLIAISTAQLSFAPVTLFTGDCDNCILADPISTPLHIVPEWYLLPFYGTLKLLPSKVAGLIAMLVFLQTLVQLVEQRKGMTVLNVQNVHRMYATKRAMIVPMVLIIGFVGMFHINFITSSIGTAALMAYIITGINCSHSGTPRHHTGVSNA